MTILRRSDDGTGNGSHREDDRGRDLKFRLGDTGGADYTRLSAFATEYKGTGAGEVQREIMDQSLLSSGAKSTKGGMKAAKFKKLTKMKLAKFEQAKFEQAEFLPFGEQRAELEKREVTPDILNWAPNADPVDYAPHCLARQDRDMITGEKAYQGDKKLSVEQRQQDVVGACYHALGAEADGTSAAETWGESGTPGKGSETDWTSETGPQPVCARADMFFTPTSCCVRLEACPHEIQHGGELGGVYFV